MSGADFAFCVGIGIGWFLGYVMIFCLVLWAVGRSR